MKNKKTITSLMLSSLLLFTSGCTDTKHTDHGDKVNYDMTPFIYFYDVSYKMMKSHQDTTLKLLNDVNRTLDSMNRINDSIFKTIDISAFTLEKLAQDFKMSEYAKEFFEIDNSFIPKFTIKKELNKKYILVSSPNRFFPDTQSIKSMFYDAKTLDSATKRAYDNADKDKNLYMTILEVGDDSSISNLTNGLLIKSSQLKQLHP